MRVSISILLCALRLITVIGIEAVVSVPAVVVIIILASSELHTLQRCLTSIRRHQANKEEVLEHIVFVNDDSSESSIEYQLQLCKDEPDSFSCAYMKPTSSKTRPHYAFAMNQGLDFVKHHMKSVPYSHFVFLRANTLVTENWLVSMLSVGAADVTNTSSMTNHSRVGLVGPLSNVAGHQSVPYAHDKERSQHKPMGLSIPHLAKELDLFVKREQIAPIPLKLLHNFCILVSRSVMENIGGHFDVEHFPSGVGAEKDLALKVIAAGYTNYVAPNAYVYHDKDASKDSSSEIGTVFISAEIAEGLGHAEEPDHNHVANKYLIEKYGDQSVKHHHQHDEQGRMTEGLNMHKIASFVESYYHHMEMRYPYATSQYSILFVLHDVAVGGGIISILQESLAMLRMGVKVQVSVPKGAAGGNAMQLIQSILPSADTSTLKKLIAQHEGSTFHPQPFSQDFMRVANQFDIVVATYCLTMRSVETVAAAHPRILPAYYVQDYEPWTWYSPFTPQNDPNSYWVKEARYTYTANELKTLMFAKTKWTAHTVSRIHNVTVHRVAPSIDHDVYYPDKTAVARKLRKTISNLRAVAATSAANSTTTAATVEKFHILAMIRPRTPRRNPENTIEVMLRLAYEQRDVVEIHLFGCKEEEMRQTIDNLRETRGAAAYRSAEFIKSASNVHILGLLVERTAIAELNRKLDVFIDLSWWQAFGRAGLEAMACGSVAVMPLTGAAPDICKNGESCLYHDGNDVDGFYSKVLTVLNNDTMRHNLLEKGMLKAQHFYLEWAAASIANALFRGLGEHRKSLTS